MKITSQIPYFTIGSKFEEKLKMLINDYKNAGEIEDFHIHNVEVHYNAFTGIYIYEVFFIIDSNFIKLQHLSLKNILFDDDDCALREIIYEVSYNKINELINKIENYTIKK